MKKNRILLTVGTVALGIAMVGVANAATIKDEIKSPPAESVQRHIYMNQENTDAMNKAMQVVITEDSNKDTDAKTGTRSLIDKNQQVKMGPRMEEDNDAGNFQKQMIEVHKNNQERMIELHKSMPHQSMQKNSKTMPVNGSQNGAKQLAGSGMTSGHHGNSGGKM